MQVICQRRGQASSEQYPAAVMPQLSLHCPSLRWVALSSAAVSFCSRCSISAPQCTSPSLPAQFHETASPSLLPLVFRHGRNRGPAGHLFKAKKDCIVQAQVHETAFPSLLPLLFKHERKWGPAGHLFKAEKHCIVQALRRRTLWEWICPH